MIKMSSRKNPFQVAKAQNLEKVEKIVAAAGPKGVSNNQLIGIICRWGVTQATARSYIQELDWCGSIAWKEREQVWVKS